MTFLTIIIELLAAVYLMLFGIRTTQKGVEGAFGRELREYLSKPHYSLGYAGMGSMLAIALQSATASAVLSINLQALGYLTIPATIAIVLGADFGSAITTLILSLKVQFLLPLLMAIGGWCYLKSKSAYVQKIGQAIFGVALILLGLRLIGEVMTPIQQSGVFAQFSTLLESDYVTAFLVGAVLAFALHSSVAAVLMCNAAVISGAISLESGLAVILGINVGASLVLFWLMRQNQGTARIVTTANLMMRGSLAVFLLLIFKLDNYSHILASLFNSVIYFHLAFNSCLALTSLLAPQIAIIAEKINGTSASGPSTKPASEAVSLLDPNLYDEPEAALLCVRRELVRMSEIILEMASPLLDLYQNYDETRAKQIISDDLRLNKSLTAIRKYVSNIPLEEMSKSERRRARRYVEEAIDLEAAGDVISKRLVRYSKVIRDENLKFSDDGWKELRNFYLNVLTNMQRNFGLLLSEDTNLARMVIEEKSRIRELEAKSRKAHFKRLQHGDISSFESSDMHLEILDATRELNSKSSTLAYHILAADNLLLDTRLKS